MRKIATNRGLVKMIVVILVILILLAYFGFNLRSIVNSPTFVDNWNYLRTLVVDLWNNVLRRPVLYSWNELFIPYIWNPIVKNATKEGDLVNPTFNGKTMSLPTVN